MATASIEFHRLYCQTQSYDWGKLGTQSKVAELASKGSDLKVEESRPFAELWMGTHPNAPSLLYGTKTELKSILNEFNVSSKVFNEYKDLPFLFKVLSIQKALSIQAHPDKELARKLVKEFPNIYKDGNHKPEMAIGLTCFEALVGFRPIIEIQENIGKFWEFSKLLGQEIVNEFLGSTLDHVAKLKKLFKTLMESDALKVKESLNALMQRIENSKDSLCELLKRVHEQYPGDVGVFCLLLLNYVKLMPGDAIYLAANEPHAYLSGDCIECMAASDNVVRSGLTPKFKDVNTLVNMLTYQCKPAKDQILKGQPFKESMYTTIYDPPIDEFAVLKTLLEKGQSDEIKGLQGPSILIITQGNGKLKMKGQEYDAHEGFVYFIGSNVTVQLTAESSSMTGYRAFCE